jgi:hypothetical protein
LSTNQKLNILFLRREQLAEKVKLPGSVSSGNVILPAVYNSLRKEIERRFQAEEMPVIFFRFLFEERRKIGEP